MQTVTSVANPLYGVATLTSAASSTVKRTKVAIPSNQEGIYSHNKNSRYIATCTLGSNQDGVITENTYWEFDITPTWFDQTKTPADHTYPRTANELLTPGFDQDINSLIARMRILLPQGMVIEDIPMYNQLNNIVSSYATDAQKKETHLLGMGAWSKNIWKERGTNPIIDGSYYQTPVFGNSLRHGRKTRVQIPFVLSSFMKVCKYIPLFLLRNGIQFEIEFEDPYRAFVQNMTTPQVQWKQHSIPAGAIYADRGGEKRLQCLKANFTFGPGTIAPDATGLVTVTTGAGTPLAVPDIDDYHTIPKSFPPYFTKRSSWRVGNADVPFTDVTFGTRGNLPISIAPGCFNFTYDSKNAAATQGNDLLQYCKNFLYLDQTVARRLLDKKIDVARSIAQPYFRSLTPALDANDFNRFNASGYGMDNLVFCVPFVLRRDGVPVHRFFTAISLFLDCYSWSRRDSSSILDSVTFARAGDNYDAAEMLAGFNLGHNNVATGTANLVFERRFVPSKWGLLGAHYNQAEAVGVVETNIVNGTEGIVQSTHGYEFRAPRLSCLFNAGGFANTTDLTAGGSRFAWHVSPFQFFAPGTGAAAGLNAPGAERPGNFQWQGQRVPACTPFEWTGSVYLAVLGHVHNAANALSVEAPDFGMVTSNVQQKAMTQVMLAFPVYKYNHFAGAGEQDGYQGEIPVFPMGANDYDENTFYPDFFNSNYTLDIGVEDSFTLRMTSAQNASLSTNVVQDGVYVKNTFANPSTYEPLVRDLQHMINFGTHYMQWDYTIENVRMIVDMCQPSSDVFSEYSTAFQSRIGIPYPITRIVTVERAFDVGTTGSQQFVVPIIARSVRNIIVTFGDPYLTGYGRHTLQAMYTPLLSSFMRRGLVQLSLTIGGATKPEYILRFDKNGGVEHLSETASSFGVPYVSNFTPCFSRAHLAPTRSYFLTGNMDQNVGTLYGQFSKRSHPDVQTQSEVATLAKNYGIDYLDSSRFIIALPLQRTDAFPFASGLDSTMVASLVITATFEQDGLPNLTNESKDPGNPWQRMISMTVRGSIDNVVTLQNDLSTSRW